MKSSRYEANIKTLEALRNAGSNSNKNHHIEHHLYCFTIEDYEKLIELGRASGYEVKYEGVIEDDSGNYWQMDLVKFTKPNIELIEIQSLEIDSFAEQANADYDGWGTEVEV
jgi:regulator of RNase E activity RraB